MSNMKFLSDDSGLAINTEHITAVRIKTNRNDGTFRNSRNYPFVVDVYVVWREKPFTMFITEHQERALSRFMKGMEDDNKRVD